MIPLNSMRQVSRHWESGWLAPCQNAPYAQHRRRRLYLPGAEEHAELQGHELAPQPVIGCSVQSSLGLRPWEATSAATLSAIIFVMAVNPRTRSDLVDMPIRYGQGRVRRMWTRNFDSLSSTDSFSYVQS
ncbi:hypothetical protein LIA77_05683 [Sarocladium implicatum]|nr:hypothetical protein LIA77_05683 [Sarocladium implicatum]